MTGKFREFFGAQDMTVGTPMRNLIKFSVPLLIGNFAQQMYSTVDSIIVGQYVGDDALAAVGVSIPIINLLLVLFMAIATGAGIMVSQYFGARDRENLSKTVGTSVVLIFLVSVAMTIFGVWLSPILLRIIRTPESIFEMANTYLVIIFWGIVGGGFFNIISGILRGLGDSVTPLIFLLIATALNIALDLLFVIQYRMGVAGVAWATILAQGVSAVLCVGRLFTIKNTLDMNRHTLHLSGALTGQLMRLGLPAGLTQGIFSLAMVMVQNLANGMGTTVVAMTIVVMRVDGFAMLPNFTFGMAVSTFVGQNIGAGLMDRVDRGSKDGALLTFCVSAALTLSLLLFGKSLVRMFTDTETIIEMGARAFRILAAGYIAMGIMQVYAGIMRGAGDTMPSMWISIVTTVILRVPSAYLLASLTRSEQWPAGSPDALYISLLISWTLGALFTYLWYRRGKWRDKAIVRRV